MPLNKEKMRDYMRERRKKKYADNHPGVGSQEKGEDDRYPDRQYHEDGSLVIYTQKCEKCERTWAASIDIPCPYCAGKGKNLREA